MDFAINIKEFKKIELELSNKAIGLVRDKGYSFEMVYLPNKLPPKKVPYIFIGMEPSFGKWAKSEIEAKEKISSGFVNFYSSKEDFILHYSIQKYLSNEYYITDVSKIAMLVKNANEIRPLIYPYWQNHLKEEIQLFQCDGGEIFSIGNTPQKVLDYIFPSRSIRKIMHYSPAARGARKILTELYPDEFELFKTSIDSNEVSDFCLNLLVEIGLSDKLFNHIKSTGIDKLKMLNNSDLQLMFSYKKEFEK